MKTFTIQQAIAFIDNNTPFNSGAIRSIAFIGGSENKFRVRFNDQTIYTLDLDEETYFTF